MKSKDDLPAPVPESSRGFFATGLSSFSFSFPFVSPGRAGRPIAIFFGPRFALGGGKDRPLLNGFELDGGGRDTEDLLGGLDDEGVDSLPLSLP